TLTVTCSRNAEKSVADSDFAANAQKVYTTQRTTRMLTLAVYVKRSIKGRDAALSFQNGNHTHMSHTATAMCVCSSN
ncbi:hypothetical protein CR513_13045, partial [Mucuna pruriens]